MHIMIWITAYLLVELPIKYLSMSDRKMLSVYDDICI